MSNKHITNYELSDSGRDEFLVEIESIEDMIQISSNWEMYQVDDVDQISFQQSQSTIVCKDIINKIINNGAQNMFDNFVNSKLTHHSVIRTFNFLALPINQNMLFYDETKQIFNSDEEPLQPCSEHWRRFNASTQKKQFEEEISANISIHTQMSPTKIEASFLPTNPEKEIKMIDFSPVEGQDHETEVIQLLYTIQMLRALKEREMQLKQESLLMEQKRLKELKEQQKQIKNNSDQYNKNSFTYDFNGLIIPLKPIQLDKLADTQFIFKPNLLKDTQIQKQKDYANQTKTDLLKDVDNRKKQVKLALVLQENTENNFEKFNMNQGVTLQSYGKYKYGPEPSQFDPKMLTDLKNQQRLTKKQYDEMVKIGNLQRNPKQATKEKINEESSIINDSKITKSELGFAIQRDRTARQKTDIGRIVVKSNNAMSIYLDGIKNEKETGQSFLFNLNNKSAVDLSISQKIQPMTTSMLDNFNQKILSCNIHEIKTKTEFNGKLPLINSSKHIETDSLGQLSKYPRNRMSQIAFQAMNFSHLPPPSYGNSLGHGINQGYNPSKIMDIDQIFNKNNKSILNQ